MSKSRPLQTFLFICALSVIASLIALPKEWPIDVTVAGRRFTTTIRGPQPYLKLGNWEWQPSWNLKQGLDIQGGMQVVLQADMSKIDPADRGDALTSAREILKRRVDLFGIAEPVVQTAQQGEDYRILVELPGVQNPDQALQLIGTTAELDFRLPASQAAVASDSATAWIEGFRTTGLTGQNLKRAQVQFDPQSGEPVIGLEFDAVGRDLFGQLTTDHTGEMLAIFIDGFPIAMPTINTPILDGRAVMTGQFSLSEAQQLAIQLNAGALPVPITVLEQRNLGASLGFESVKASLQAGLLGIGLVMVFMIAIYGWQGFLACMALVVYALLTIATYKILGITLTLPGLAGLLLSIGMAVDSNILVFERLKEELRRGRAFSQAMQLGFGRAWDSIKDANVATLLTASILVNPLDWPFLNTSGLVRGFGITLLIGVVISLFTGLVVTRTLMRLFLKGSES